MALKDCLANAVAGEEISQGDADRIGREYDRAYRRAQQDGPGLADAEAKRAVQELLKAETEHQKVKAKLAIKTAKRIGLELDAFRNAGGQRDVAAAALFMLDHNGEAKFTPVTGRHREIVGMAHARMESLLGTFRRSKLLGDKKRLNAAQFPNIVRELFGEDTGDVAAQGMAQAWTDTANWLRQRFNRAGGAIGQLEHWGLPQHHDARALLARGRRQWIEDIRPMLDTSRMEHPLTKTPIGADELDDVLGDIWDGVVTDGWDKREAKRQAQGKGALANQRGEHRFLVFKDADTWMKYQADYGGGSDVFATMMHHINMMSRDIAAMEILGPNPSTTLDWLKQIVRKEAMLKVAGKESRFAGKAATAIDRAGRYEYRLQNVWDDIRGNLNAPVSGRMANIFAATRNVIVSSVLGSAAISAISDIGTQQVTRAMAGMPVTGAFKQTIASMISKATQQEAVAAGLILDAAEHVHGGNARYVGTFSGPEWSAYLGDRVLALSLLTPWTQGGKHAFGLAFLHELGKQVGKGLSEMHPLLREKLEQYGISGLDWDRIRATDLHQRNNGLKILRPTDVAQLHPALGERLLGMVLSETEYAIPSNTARSRTLLINQNRPGTVAGEILRSFAMFKSFGAVYAMLHGGRIAGQLMAKQRGRAAAYAGSLLITGMLYGGLAMQLKAIAAGKDPQDMRNPNFWGGAMLQGGGLGIYGDFLFSDVNRFGGGLTGTIAGPGFERVSEFRDLTIGNAIELAQGKETHFGRELVKFMRGNIPGGNIWYIRQAWEHGVLDQLQWLIDPEASKSFKTKISNTKRSTGQGYWWRPGSALPDRLPDLGAAIGRPVDAAAGGAS